MKLNWSGFGAVDGRGKIGGHVASKNRAGAYARTKVSPVNPQTTYQQNSRNLLTTLSQAWRSLTQAQRNAWDAAVPDYARTDVFGNLRNPTGKNLFTRLNVNLQLAGIAVINDPPTPSGAGAITAGALVMTNGGAKTIAFTPTPAGTGVQVWATAGVSPGKKFVKNDLRLIDTLAAAATSPANIASVYQARFGEPAVGTRVTVRLVPFNETTGEVGIGSEATTITV